MTTGVTFASPTPGARSGSAPPTCAAISAAPPRPEIETRSGRASGPPVLPLAFRRLAVRREGGLRRPLRGGADRGALRPRLHVDEGHLGDRRPRAGGAPVLHAPHPALHPARLRQGRVHRAATFQRSNRRYTYKNGVRGGRSRPAARRRARRSASRTWPRMCSTRAARSPRREPRG